MCVCVGGGGGGGNKYYATVYMYSVSEMRGLQHAFNESFKLPSCDSNFKSDPLM